ncbi:hypothetical protein ABZ252_08300 [Streptomyces sp. NPDC006175]|uniref:hypothetical protein n=1 Tax=unclassified Streptomyces TaxID=2593676 RepID=UPI0033B79B95
MKKRSLLVTIALTGALAGGGLAGATSASAATCYGSYKSFYKSDGTQYAPTGNSYWSATSNCDDINIKIPNAKSVKVCFYKKPSGSLNYCQTNYKTTRANEWTAIATDVNDGTIYRFKFADADYNRSGFYAS